MAVTDPTQSRTVIYYKETIPPPDSVELDENSLCVGRHGKPIIQASPYSGQLYCEDCLALGSGGQALHCQCCNAVVGEAPKKPFSNCVKVSGINTDETPEYLCRFCKEGLITPEEITQCIQFARIWFQNFLKEGSQAAPQLVWTLSEDPKIDPRKLSEIISLGGHVTGVTQSEPYRKSSNDTKDSYTHNIFILAKLRRLQFMVVTVHELTHCWQAENGATLENQKRATNEGFAEWVSYKFLLWRWKNSKVAESKKEIQGLAEQKRRDQSFYGEGLRDWIYYEDIFDFSDFLPEVVEHNLKE